MMLLIFLSGCGTVARSLPPKHSCWSDQEQLSERTRTYSEISQQQLLDVAESLLKLSWKSDVEVSKSRHTLTAKIRSDSWFYLFLVAYFGVVDEFWLITTRPDAAGVNVCVQIQGQYLTDTYVLGAEPVTHVVYPVSAVKRPQGPFTPPAEAMAIDFGTIWARMDYLLGLRSDWLACSSNGPHKNPTRDRMEFDPFCHNLIASPARPSPPPQRQPGGKEVND
ncbi:hypothetical protein [Methylophaga sp.]|uniref:hypothetical protein n=1 Tax=Methylophaga sp. TaxID=2024840 RepID=UPI0013FF1AAA|nr:hypothetical protein [Methylophaga sp.]MTI63792.1 hypothetical protein [Methylophaga sp.]